MLASNGASQSWSVIVFCYNEAGTVVNVIDQIEKLLDANRRGLYEIIVVDDGSTDGSTEKINAAKKTRPDVIRVVFHERNLGIGRTLIDGYKAAKNENVIGVPAVGQFNVQEMVPFLDVEEGTFVSFYRLETQYTTFRTILSAANKYVNKINGIDLKDVNWVKIYKRKEITAFPWKLHSNLIESELCAKLLLRGNRSIEVLSYYHPRRSGKSKGASVRVVVQAVRETLKLIFVVREFKHRTK